MGPGRSTATKHGVERIQNLAGVNSQLGLRVLVLPTASEALIECVTNNATLSCLRSQTSCSEESSGAIVCVCVCVCWWARGQVKIIHANK